MANDHPENSLPELSPQKSLELVKRLNGLFQWMALEGIIDPRDGTDFEIRQYQVDAQVINPDTSYHEGPKKLIVQIGLPSDPIQSTLDRMEKELDLKKEE